MCDLAATGIDATPWIILALAVLAVGATLLVRSAKGRVAVLGLLMLVGAGSLVTLPQPAFAADCAPAAPAAPEVPVAVLPSALLTLSAAAWDAGSGEGSTTFVVTNASTTDATSVTAALTGSTAFTVESSTCSGTLAASASCAIVVAVVPVSTGPVDGTLTIGADNATAVSASLMADPAIATISVSPASLVIPPGTSGSITVTNLSSTASALNLAISGMLVDWSTSSTCSATLAPGSSCTFSIAVPTLVAGTTTLTVSGDNTNVVTASVEARQIQTPFPF